jgi:hypothetical protein
MLQYFFRAKGIAHRGYIAGDGAISHGYEHAGMLTNHLDLRQIVFTEPSTSVRSTCSGNILLSTRGLYTMSITSASSILDQCSCGADLHALDATGA